ncbi:hypothetical protein [Pontimicrobium aquaticum]|uniref:Uncharacterized protein n=1 Tax=Pontimicrobium aquaticum TaxID=2565367 RepID=A0A4V5LR56_9FLAO|nr:hypothetical protein [Pontimicrobium aquaticum]TJY37939.1 hypothetical protein E5167_01395 [Pontimicrobium aquaticum]
MKLLPEIKLILENIKFENTYRTISKNYSVDKEEMLENHSIEKVLSIFKSLNYSFKYNKKEKFYGLNQSVEDYLFTFNISLRYGIVEFIWALRKNGELITLGGPWAFIIRLLNNGDKANIKKPSFSNYEDLESILKEGLSLYEDFKLEVLKIEP